MSEVDTAGPPPNIPTLNHRLFWGFVRMIPVLVLLVGVPVALINFLNEHGITTPVSLLQVTAAGVLLSLVGAIRYVVRPTRAFGPVSMVAAAVAIFYLWTLFASASVHIASDTNSVTFGFADVIALLMIVPAFSFAAAIVTTIEDRVRPGQRIRIDYPA